MTRKSDLFDFQSSWILIRKSIDFTEDFFFEHGYSQLKERSICEDPNEERDPQDEDR